jgi:hypothetical protein
VIVIIAIIRGTPVVVIAGIISVIIAIESIVTEWIPEKVRIPPVESHPVEGAGIKGAVAVIMRTVAVIVIIIIVISFRFYSDPLPGVSLVDGGTTGNKESQNEDDSQFFHFLTPLPLYLYATFMPSPIRERLSVPAHFLS